jgi:hypothetical protein
MKRTIMFAAIALLFQTSFCYALTIEKTPSPNSVVPLGNDSNRDKMFFPGKKATESIYMNAYFTIYKDLISDGGKFTSDELSDVIDYYMSNENLAKNMDSYGTRSNERISDILKRAGVNLGAGDYCYIAYSFNTEICCVDVTSNPDECYLDSVCQGDKCVENGGRGCYMTSSAYGGPCCVDYTVPYGYCYLKSGCDGDICADQSNPTPPPTSIPASSSASGCGAFICGDMICDASFPYDSMYDEAEPGSACCCEQDCRIPCSSSSTITPVVAPTTTIPSPAYIPFSFQDNSSGYITSSIYGDSCCVDSTLPYGYCYANSVFQDGLCIDKEPSCYMTSSIYGGPCCTDATLPLGYCYVGSICQKGVCV